MNEFQNALIGFTFTAAITWLAVAVLLEIITGRQPRRPQNPADLEFRENQARQWDMLYKHNAAVRKKQLAALSNVYA